MRKVPKAREAVDGNGAAAAPAPREKRAGTLDAYAHLGEASVASTREPFTIYTEAFEPEYLERWFEPDGRYRVPEDVAAETWSDAQRLAARGLDLRAEYLALLSERHGPPRLWSERLAARGRRVHLLTHEAVRVVVEGTPPDRTALFSEVLGWATSKAEDEARQRGVLAAAFRARLAYLMGSVSETVLAHERDKTPEDVSADHQLEAVWRAVRARRRDTRERAAPGERIPVPAHDQQLPPLSIAQRLEEAEHEARCLAEIGDPTAARVAAVIRGTIAQLWRRDASPFDGVALPPELQPSDDKTTRITEIGRAVAKMNGAAPRERAGAAFLLGAAAFGFGPGWRAPWPRPPAFEAALEDAWGRAADDDEDRGVINSLDPVLRWKQSLRNGLYALGYDADLVTNGALKAARARAKEAHAAARDGRGSRPES